MKNKIVLILFICCSISLIDCKKNASCYWAPEPAPPIFFQLTKNGQPITDSAFLFSVRLSYYHNNTKYYLPYFGLAGIPDTNAYNKNGVMHANIGAIAVSNPSNLFYIEYPNNFSTQDTLYVDYLTPSTNTNCEWEVDKILFNDKVPTTTTEIMDFSFPVYIFNKQ